MPSCLEQLRSNYNTTPGYCGPTFDAVLCWPETPINATAKLLCPPLGDYEFITNGGYAYRLCQANGTWSRLGNYTGCIPADGGYGMRLSHMHVQLMYSMYWIGYIVSLLICVFALVVFVHYKKGARALLILCPLLGINYLFVLYQPRSPRLLSLAVHYYTVIISSMQVQECLKRSFSELRLSLKMRAERKRQGASDRQSGGEHSQITLISLSQHP
ncbi:Parathyroid hormone 2 receptor [Toxocara canis]|uniref:Parathyroid hormone 2 receptor n=1 Tax=Toxocara canis TaxID=6265 RepID=A0A0B2VF14_TOXCA|nr:Parathyroid hormone 2 receptor [Toxocara canis]